MRIRIKSFWPAIGMFILATILFCIPGDELPDEAWLGEINADKLVHVALFAMLVALWALPYVARGRPDANSRSLKTSLFWIVGVTIVYGIAIEIIQGAYVPYRSYSVADMVADGVGSVIGGFFVNRQISTRVQQ